MAPAESVSLSRAHCAPPSIDRHSPSGPSVMVEAVLPPVDGVRLMGMPPGVLLYIAGLYVELGGAWGVVSGTNL